jgi:hypothetical protein
VKARRCPVRRPVRCGAIRNRLATKGMTMTTLPCRVTAGVDTHLDVRVVAALDERGGC